MVADFDNRLPKALANGSRYLSAMIIRRHFAARTSLRAAPRRNPTIFQRICKWSVMSIFSASNVLDKMDSVIGKRKPRFYAGLNSLRLTAGIVNRKSVRSAGVKRVTTYARAPLCQVGFIRLRERRFMDAGLNQFTGPW